MKIITKFSKFKYIKILKNIIFSKYSNKLNQTIKKILHIQLNI